MPDMLKNSTLILSNEYLERVVEIDDGLLRSEPLLSRIDGALLSWESDEFRVGLVSGEVLTHADLRVTGHEAVATGSGGTRLIVHIAFDSYGIEGGVVYTLNPEHFYTRKQLHLRASRDASHHTPLLLDWVEVESFHVQGTAKSGAKGQPVFIGDTFFLGLEYPAGYNVVEDGRVALRHYPGVKLTSEGWVSKTAVFGVAPQGEVGAWFLKYVEQFRRKRKPFFSYNTGGDIQIYNPVQTPNSEDSVMDCLTRLLSGSRENICERHGIPLHSFVLDAGWQNPMTLYEVDETKFPGGFGELNRQLADMGAALGLWLSVTTPLTPAQLDREFMEAAGFEIVSSGRYPCLSGARYYPAIREIVRKHIVENKVRYFKFDFNYFECLFPDHNHLPDAVHSVEANLDAHLDLLGMVASLDEDIVIVPTCGMWLSPWWLMHADTIWPHTMWDFNYDRRPVALKPRLWEQTCRDENLYQLLRVEECQFPFSGITSCWCAGGPRYNIAGPFEPLRERLDDAVHGTSRQLRLAEKWIPSPVTMLEGEADFIAALLKWAFHHADRVPECQMILGQPAKGQVYGFSYLGEHGGVISLRNPSMREQSVTVPLAPLSLEEQYSVQVTYPYRHLLTASATRDTSCSVGVEPYGVVIVEVQPAPADQRPAVSGCRYSIIEDSPGELTVELWAEPGKETPVRIVSGTAMLSVLIDGEQTSLTDPHVAQMTIPSKGQPFSVPITSLPSVKDRDGVERQMVRVDIPGAFCKSPPEFGTTTKHPHAQFVDAPNSWRTPVDTRVLLLSETSRVRSPRLSVNMGGWFGGLPFETVVGDGWTAYAVRIDLRELNIIGWGFSPEPGDAPQPRSSLWLINERHLVAKQLTISYTPAAIEQPPSLPTPFAGLRREIFRIDHPDAEPVTGLPWTDEYAEAGS